MRPDIDLKLRLLKAGMKQVDLARLVGITPGRLNTYVNGYVRMPREIRRKIEGVLAEEERG